ncbi:MAG: FHA domain-containing protein [Bdellovibrio sp.]
MGIFLVTIRKQTQETHRELQKEFFTVGRGVDCDISLNDFHISRLHLRVFFRGEAVWIEDKNSSNGTFINSNKLSPGASVEITPTDVVQLGTSEYTLEIKLKPVIPVKSNPVVFQPKALPVIEDTVNMSQISVIKKEAEQPIIEAKKKAAQIVLEGEKQAEIRAQAIFQMAKESQEAAERSYRQRVTAAQKKADEILNQYQSQGQDLLKDARKLAQELRDEVETSIKVLKEKAKKEAEEIIAQGKSNSERIKNEAIEEGRAKLKAESEEAQKKIAVEQDKIKELTASSLELEKKLSVLKTSLSELTTKEKEVSDLLEKEEQELKRLLRDKQSELKAVHDKEDARLKAMIEHESNRIKDLQETKKLATDEKERLDNAIRLLQEKQVQLGILLQGLEDKKEGLTKDFELQKKALIEKLEQEKQKIDKDTQQYHEEMRLEVIKRVKKLEHEHLDAFVEKRDLLKKKIFSAVQRQSAAHSEVVDWNKLSVGLEEKLNAVIDEELIAISQSTLDSKKPIDLKKQKDAEKTRLVVSGLVMGAALYFAGQYVYERVRHNQAPLQAMVNREAKSRQEDLERRRFNPPQAPEIRDNYTDSVIYTQNFVNQYTDPKFQQKLYKAVSQYMLKTWRVDEDKSIQVLALSNSLVKGLEERRQKIHPDFVKDGIEKMHALETETIANMKQILGTEVRVESYLTFERNFYKTNVSN